MEIQTGYILIEDILNKTVAEVMDEALDADTVVLWRLKGSKCVFSAAVDLNNGKELQFFAKEHLIKYKARSSVLTADEDETPETTQQS